MKRLPDLGALSPEKRALLEKRLAEQGLAAPAGNRIRARGDASPAPLTSLQEGLWFIDQLDPLKATYNVPMTARLRGPLDAAVLERALRELVVRQESLRTTFRTIDGQVRQVIGSPEDFALHVRDLSTEADPEAAGLALAIAEARMPMDLAEGPLFRAALFRLAPDDHFLVITIHHIVTDGWSMGVLTRELTALYAAFATGEDSPLKPLPIQFADYANWQQERLRGPELERLRGFWRRTLSGHSFVLALPVDHERPALQSGSGRHLTFRLPAEATGALRRVAREEGITLFALTLAVFYTLLAGLSGEDDLIVGTPIANRNLSELEGLVGYFVNLLPLRARVPEKAAIVEFARQVHRVTVEANEHQELPFGRLVEDLQPARAAGRNPIFQVEFTLLDPAHAPPVYGYGFSSPVRQELRFAGLAMSPVEVESEASKFDLTVLLWDMPDGIAGTFEYNVDLFEPDTIEQVADQYAALLGKVSKDPSLNTSDLKSILAETILAQKNLARTERRSRQTDRIQNIRRRPVSKNGD